MHSNLKKFNVEELRKDFPILKSEVYQKPLVYLDNSATTQKPHSVIQRISDYYQLENSNIHRGVHYLSQQATDAYEQSREKVKDWINADSTKETIFVRGCTEAINLVATSYGEQNIQKDDVILISALEHHANIVPWQVLAKKKEAILKVIPVDERGQLKLSHYKELLTEQVKLVALTHVSNALGTVNPIKEMIQMAKSVSATVLVDGAQAMPHFKIDVQDLDCDFYCLSGHKMFGPTGIGLLYGKKEILEKMPPYQTGGDMILSVNFEDAVYNELPHKFEAGTPNIAGVIGLATAIDYLKQLDFSLVAQHEAVLLEQAQSELQKISGLKIVGEAEHKVSVISFVFDDIHPHDVGTILDREGVAIRTGHHCAQPLLNSLGHHATSRASFAFYNNSQDVEALICAVQKVKKVFG